MCVRGNKFVFKNNGNVFREKVFVFWVEDVLQCDEDELDKLQEILVVILEEKCECGSRFVVSGIFVKIYGEVCNFYKMLCFLLRYV